MGKLPIVEGEIIDRLNKKGGILACHHTNQVICFLTAITTILMPLTLLASLYGMNVNLLGQEHDLTFIITILLIMLAAIGGMLFYCRRRHWI